MDTWTSYRAATQKWDGNEDWLEPKLVVALLIIFQQKIHNAQTTWLMKGLSQVPAMKKIKLTTPTYSQIERWNGMWSICLRQKLLLSPVIYFLKPSKETIRKWKAPKKSRDRIKKGTKRLKKQQPFYEQRIQKDQIT